jgi:hypothetical protein
MRFAPRANVSRRSMTRRSARPRPSRPSSSPDPIGAVDRRTQGPCFFAYAANYLIDTDHGVIVDVEATRAIRQAEVGAAQTMIEPTETCFGMKPALLSQTAPTVQQRAWLGSSIRR